MTQENQRIRQTKRLLKDALLSLLEQHALLDVSVSELCKRAGINRTTFYNHYGSPSDVLEEIQRDHLAQIQARLDALQAEGELTLRSRVETICTYLRENERTVKVLLSQRGDAEAFAVAILSIGSTGAPDLDGLLRSYDEPTRRLLTTFLTNGIYSFVRQWLLEDVPKTPHEMGELAAHIALHGWVDGDARANT